MEEDGETSIGAQHKPRLATWRSRLFATSFQKRVTRARCRDCVLQHTRRGIDQSRERQAGCPDGRSRCQAGPSKLRDGSDGCAVPGVFRSCLLGSLVRLRQEARSMKWQGLVQAGYGHNHRTVRRGGGWHCTALLSSRVAEWMGLGADARMRSNTSEPPSWT